MKKSRFHPKVSIVIPVYNGSNYLREAIDSALSQTYDNVEVIVVNDGSNDNGKTDEICKSYGDKIRYFVKENGGVATALNKGIEEMKGEYFSWLSHDDVYYPNKVEQQVKCLSKLSDKKTIIYSGFEIIDENSELVKTENFWEANKIENLNNPYFPILRAVLNGCTLIIPKKCFEEKGLFNEELKATQDYDLWFKMFPQYKIVFLPTILIKSRRHLEQGSKRIPTAKQEADKLWVYMIANTPEDQIYKLFKTKLTFYKSCLAALKNGCYTGAQEYLQNLIEEEEKNPKVSIIIPVYNGSNYLAEAINSALKQTYKNIEILVVNDGSLDDGATERVAMQYKDKIKYFSKPNGGTSTALNVGIKHMTGDYFSWLSHDDQYYPKKIQRQVEELRKLKNKNTIMMTDLDGIDEDYNKIYKTCYINHVNAYPPREQSLLHPIIYNQTHGCTLLIPKACFDEVGLFDEEEKVAQDFEFFYRAFSKFPHKLIPEILVTARDSSNRQGRRSKSKGNEEYSRLYIKMIKSLSEDDYKLLAPSKLEFYEDMMFFFDSAGYTYAWDYVSNLVIKNLQISSYDLVGNKFNGHDLHKYLREKGISSKQMVLYKESDDSSTFQFDFMAKDSSKYLLMQKEFFNTDIVHLHLIHNIFDFNYLPMMTRMKPTVITLHDPFFLSGHCVHHFDCEKWKTHCQDCPYLNSLFPMEKDFTSFNYELRRKAILESNISVIVASKWMEEKVKQSPIWKDKKVFLLPFGVNQELFKPSDTKLIRDELGIPRENIVIMFRATDDDFKGLDLIIKALKELKSRKKVTLLTVDKEKVLQDFEDKYDIREYGWIKDDNLLAKLYQSSDIFLMPSRQETFGLMAVEAMSCGKTVLSIRGEGTALPGVINDPECGICVNENDFSKELQRLINKPKELQIRGEKSLKYARKNYSKDNYIDKMIDIYKEVISSHKIDKESELILSQFKKYLSEGINIPTSLGYKNNGTNRKLNKFWNENSLSRRMYRTLIPLEGRKFVSKVFIILLRQGKMLIPPKIRAKIKSKLN